MAKHPHTPGEGEGTPNGPPIWGPFDAVPSRPEGIFLMWVGGGGGGGRGRMTWGLPEPQVTPPPPDSPPPPPPTAGVGEQAARLTPTHPLIVWPRSVTRGR